MSITIKYQEEFAEFSVSSYLKAWAAGFGNIELAPVKDRGQFYGGSDGFNGHQFSIGSSHNTETSLIAKGNLHYTFYPQHTLHGNIDEMQFGEGLEPSIGGGRHIVKTEVTFSGLDITGQYDPALTEEQNHQGDMHKTVYGLMKGDPDPMLEVLKARGVDVDSAVNTLSIASQYNSGDVMADAPFIEAIGVAEFNEMLLAA
ncbi:heme acquisition protein HasA [Yersinia nurmii]|uniref:Heme acquisition protein HasA n=1 Tax=Yersinia nurmii TaxID=685706 RepID=A0AAW7K022_9GAMM|nr:heme acquisition protein HasA [Yersinia nurmii]MDN0088393.1 heme acquisition protein HasA [Yersinia nurmii]CNF14836.1 hemophore HasA [Yersinia nurmii]